MVHPFGKIRRNVTSSMPTTKNYATSAVTVTRPRAAEDGQFHRHHGIPQSGRLRDGKRGADRRPQQEHVGADAFILQVRRFLLRAVKDVQAGKEAPG
jgi:hypothetical protein